METCPQCGSDRRDMRYLLRVEGESSLPGPPGSEHHQRKVACQHLWHDERPYDCTLDGHDIEHITTASGDILKLFCGHCSAVWEVTRVR